ncbi:MAG: metallophosphoesterase family protein [Pseudomonadota bacterium]
MQNRAPTDEVLERPLVYAIGDIHGCVDLLEDLLETISADAAQVPRVEKYILCLGDYVDRGPQSAAVIARLRSGVDGFDLITLSGNHETMMVDALSGGDPQAVHHWLANGGAPTLVSYGVDPHYVIDVGVRHLPSVLRADLEWMRDLPLAIQFDTPDGAFFFVHAGVRPGMPLDSQTVDDVLWIREPFLRYTGDFGARIVHGHTPVGPEVLWNRINLDAGAFMHGALYAAALDCEHSVRQNPRLLFAGESRRYD